MEFSKSWILSCLCGLFLITVASSLQQCKKAGCEGEDCPMLACVNGECEEARGCVCQGCWNGESCDQFENRHPPNFVQVHHTLNVQPVTSANEVVYQVHAADEDYYDTCNLQNECPCADILYSMTSEPDYGLFKINENTGEIITTRSLLDFNKDKFLLTVRAWNHGDSESGASEATVNIFVEENVNQENLYRGSFQDDNVMEPGIDTPHIRKRRALDSTVSQPEVIPTTPIFPDNITFYLYKTNEFENVTTMYIGSKIHFQLVIHFPGPSQSSDMLVELFTPDNETTIMIICDPKITHVGSNLVIDSDKMEPVMDSKDGSFNYDRAVYNFSTISTGTVNDDAHKNMLVIEWDAVMIKPNDTSINGTVYWVSAGAEYYNEDEVWVGQASFMTVTDDYTPADFPVFNMTGNNSVQIGTSHTFKVDMFLPYPYLDLSFDVFSPLNTTDIMSVCGVVLTDAGENYPCLDGSRYKAKMYPSDTGDTNYRGRLEVGYVYNTGARDPSNDQSNNRITFEFVISVANNEALIGNEYWIGAAAELGDDQIWAGQIKVVVENKTTPPEMTETPTFVMSVDPDKTAVTVGEPVVVDLEMTLPASSSGTYKLEVLMPFNDTARFTACRLSIIYSGVNNPCVPDIKPEYSSRANTTVMDRIVWNLGPLYNFNLMPDSKDPDANKIRFQIVGQVLNHTLNENGEKLWVTAGMTFDGNRIWVGQHAVTLDLTRVLTVDNGTAPTFDIKYAFGTDHIHIGALADVRFEISTKESVIYYPNDMELILPFESSQAIFSVCKAEVVHVGKNMPCVDQNTLNNSISYTSKANTTVMDKVLLTFGGVCNIGNDGHSTPEPDDDKIIVRLVLKVEDHPALANGTKKWVSGGLMYSDTRMWVGQIALYALRDEVIAYGTEVPYTNFVRAGDDENDMAIPIGVAKEFLYIIQTPPQTTGEYRIDFDTAGTAISFCSIRILEAGGSIPCLDTSIIGNETKYPDGIYNKGAYLELGIVTNVGDDDMMYNTTFDNNTIVLQVMVQLLPGAAATEDFTVVTTIGGTALPTETYTLELDSAVPTYTSANTTNPNFTFYQRAMLEEDTLESNIAYKGHPVRFNLDIMPADNTINKLVVKFLTPVNDTGVMEVTNVHVVFVGQNIPCLQRLAIEPTYEKRTGSEYVDVGTVDLGFVCQVPFDATDPESNVVRVEAIAKLNKNDSIEVGSQVWFSTSVRINDDQIYVSQIGLTVYDNYTDNATVAAGGDLAINTTDTVFLWSPGEVYTVPIVLTVPANVTAQSMIDIDLPFNESAVMTIEKVTVINSGVNLGGFANTPTDFTATFNSTGMSSQNDDAILDLGWVTNTGHTYRAGSWDDALDNFIALEAEIQMADSVVNENGSEHLLSIGAKIGGSLFILDKQVQVIRDNQERPELNLTANLNETRNYTVGDIITVECLLKHTETSAAEGYNVTALFYVPPYLVYDGISVINFTEPQVSNATGEYGIALRFDTIYFTDIVQFSFKMKVSLTSTLPDGTVVPVDATSPFEAGSQMIYRANHDNESGTFFMTQLDNLSYRISAPTEACVPQPLGMEDGSVQDCQIDGSHSPDPAFQPKDARFNGAGGWMAATRRGAFNKYIDVNFGNLTKVTQVILQHPTATGISDAAYVASYKLKYSDDGIFWQDGETFTPSNPYTTETFNLLSPVDARYIRLVVESNTVGEDGKVALKAEFHGCRAGNGDVNIEDVCNAARRAWATAEESPPAEFYSRGFVATTTSAYYCDANPNKNNRMECFSSSDGVVWNAIDKTVVNVIGFSPTYNELYGIAWDKRAFMVSKDEGSTWHSVSYNRIAMVKALSDWKAAKEVPWVLDAAVTTGTPATVGETWEGNYEGIYRDESPWRKVADWTKCCV